MAWTMTVPTRHVDSDGTARITAVFSDETGERGTLTVALTDESNLTVMWMQADGADPVTFSAWSNT